MPSNQKGGTGNGWADAGILAAGFGGGLAPDVSNTSGSGTTNTNSSSEGNTNSYQNSSSESAANNWLNTLLEAIQQMSGTTSTNFNLDPATQQLLNSLIANYQKIATPFDSRNYQAGQIQNINANSDLARQSAANIMASRGVSGPAAATAEANIDANRIGQITSMQQQVPFLANQWNLGNLGAAGQFFGMIPKGTTTQTQQTNTSSQTGAQSGGSNTSNQTGTYGGSTYYNQGWQKTDKQEDQQSRRGGGVLSGLAGLAATAASLFSDKTLKREIEQIDKGEILDRVKKLNPVSWRWKEDNEQTVGLIAQDLKKVMPELVKKDEESGKLKVNYAGLLSELVGAIQAVAEGSK